MFLQSEKQGFCFDKKGRKLLRFRSTFKASVLDLTHDCSIGMNNAYLVMLTSAAACCQRMADNLS